MWWDICIWYGYNLQQPTRDGVLFIYSFINEDIVLYRITKH